MATKKTVNKAETKVEASKATAAVKEAPVKVAPVKEAPVKEAPVKEAAKEVKKASPKKEVKTTLFVQYFGKEVAEKDMIASVKKAWTQAGNKVGDIKTITLYVKPEESAVYYVINGTETGKVEF